MTWQGICIRNRPNVREHRQSLVLRNLPAKKYYVLFNKNYTETSTHHLER